MKVTSCDNKEFTVGDQVFNYYDMRLGTITSEPENDGWFYFTDTDNFKKFLNGERICSIETATKKGWL